MYEMIFFRLSQPVIRLYDIPDNTFETEDDDDDDGDDESNGGFGVCTLNLILQLNLVIFGVNLTLALQLKLVSSLFLEMHGSHWINMMHTSTEHFF